MAVKKAVYSREFISETDSKYEDYQALSKQDILIRKEISQRFCFIRLNDLEIGFDGETLYSFLVKESRFDGNSAVNREYQTKIHITKSGTEMFLEDNVSDLEKFLKLNGFRKSE